MNNKPALMWIIVWHRKGDKPLSEQIMTKFTDIYALLADWQYLCIEMHNWIDEKYLYSSILITDCRVPYIIGICVILMEFYINHFTY